MKRNLLNFGLGKRAEELVATLESKIGSEIVLREMRFPGHDMSASARGGFESWVPFVGINIELQQNFDEHALAHELLHIKRFLEGAYILETPDRLRGRTDVDAQNRMRFVDDVTNQVEHIAIFPELKDYGFEPDKIADDWKRRQIRELSSMPKQWGQMDHSWACIKLGVGDHIGTDEKLNQDYKRCFQKIDREAIRKGQHIAQLIHRWGVTKLYNLRKLYRQMLQVADVPRGTLLLKQFDFSVRRERLETI